MKRAARSQAVDRLQLVLAAALLIACLVSPTWPIERGLFDAVAVFDVTQSMNVEDMRLEGRPVSRLTAARAAVKGLLTRVPCGSKLGLGVFTEHRSLLLLEPVEVCTHLQDLRQTIDGIDGRIAWTGNSEVAKGLHSALRLTVQVQGRPTLLFFTDGHEAPPLNPRHRPRFDGKAREVGGLLVGVGGLQALPIPKVDPTGRPLGQWEPDEVLQIDPRSLGRGGSIGGERMVEDGDGRGLVSASALGATPGSEHLSSLREAYVQLLAEETGLGYHRLEGSDDLARAATADEFVRPVRATTDLAPGLAALALLLLLARHGAGVGRLARALRRRLAPGGSWRRGTLGRPRGTLAQPRGDRAATRPQR